MPHIHRFDLTYPKRQKTDDLHTRTTGANVKLARSEAPRAIFTGKNRLFLSQVFGLTYFFLHTHTCPLSHDNNSFWEKSP
jgi:hypothetical protein